MRYVFMDHTTHPLGTLGALHLRLASTPPRHSADGFLLHTCHRAEWYTQRNWNVPIPELAARPRLRGEEAALIRLSQIAAGARSLVVGDGLVLRQVIDAGRRVTQTSLRRFVSQAVRIAEEARRKFDLVPVVDYADLPRAWAAGMTPTDGLAVRRLIIVGGGMLAQAMASASTASYDHVIMVTGNTARLRRTVANLPLPATSVAVTRARDAIARYTAEPFNLVIATTSSRPSYLDDVAALAAHENAAFTLDLSATPLPVRTAPRYSHIADRSVLAWISDINQPVEARAAEARTWIRAEVAGLSARTEPARRPRPVRRPTPLKTPSSTPCDWPNPSSPRS